VEYFKWNQFKSFLKKVRSSGIPVMVYGIEDNSMGFPERERILKKVLIRSFKMELWEQNATYHIEIGYDSDRIIVEIPADAMLISGSHCFGYKWIDGPTNVLMFYDATPEGIESWKNIQRR